MSRRGRQLTRTYVLLALLRAWGGTTLARLATETGFSDRTIRRDLEALQLAGLPITDEDREGTRTWRLIKGAPCPVCGVHR